MYIFTTPQSVKWLPSILGMLTLWWANITGCWQTLSTSIPIYILLDDDEHEWIVRTCRKGWDEIIGYRENPADKYINPSSTVADNKQLTDSVSTPAL